MRIKIPAIGIPHYWWNKRACKYAKKYPNLVKMAVSDLVFGCNPHINFLKYIDDLSKNVKESEYWEYQKRNKKEEVIWNKIKKYKQTYRSIKDNGFNALGDKYNSSIIVTDDGCRLDGSHRVAILFHLGILEVDVNVVVYEKVFSKKESEKIRKENLEYRKETYGL